MLDTRRVAVVGLGNAGTTLHLPALAGIPSVTTVGACDMDVGRRQRAATRFGVPVFDSFEAMLAKGKPGVVIIGTPPHTHAELCLRSFEAGADVICEKPFASSAEEADSVVAAAAKAGRRVALNHEFREMPVFRALRDEVDSSGGDDVVFAQCWQLMDLPPWAEPGWRGRMLQGTLYEAGVHLVDFLMALFHEVPVSVSATLSTCGMRKEATDAVAVATLEFSRGRLAVIVQDRLCKGETQYMEVRAETPNASLRASFGGRARLLAGLFRSTRPRVRFEYGVSGLAWREVGGDRTVLASNPKDPGMVATRHVFEKTLTAFQNGTQPPASGEDGRDVLEVIAACYLSAADGRRVDIGGPERDRVRALRMGTPAGV